MNTYIVSYDLRNPGRNYGPLYDALKSFSGWAHPLESVWTIVSADSSSSIRDLLAKHLDSNDGLLVIRLGSSGAWKGLGDKISKWLKDHL